MVGSCVIGALEIACRGRYPVRLPNGHIENPCFYIIPIAAPSERKSGVISCVMQPLNDWEKEYNLLHDTEVKQNKSALKVLEGKITHTENSAVKKTDKAEHDEAMRELKALNKELSEFERIESIRLYTEDVTPEKLATMIKAQGEGLALVSAEGGGIFENIGRYSDKGGMEIYLKGYSGDRITIDRKNSDSIVIEKPCMSLLAPRQPSVISALFADGQASGRGLLTRMLFINCTSRVGTRKSDSTAMDTDIADNYRKICYNLLSEADKGILEFDSDALKVYESFFDEIEVQETPDIGDLAEMADWAAKLHGNMIRIAGLLHCINAAEHGRSPLDTKINHEEACCAEGLAQFFLAHAKAVYLGQEEPMHTTHAKYLWKRVNSLNSLKIQKFQM